MNSVAEPREADVKTEEVDERIGAALLAALAQARAESQREMELEAAEARRMEATP